MVFKFVYVCHDKLRGDFLGFWYILLLLIGVMLVLFGLTRKSVSKDVKFAIISITFGIILVICALLLLLPGSSDLISTLLGINN